MKTFVDWALKSLTGALAVVIFLAAASLHVFPLTVPLLAASGRTLALNMPDAFGLIVFVCLAATFFYIIGYGTWKTMSLLWSEILSRLRRGIAAIYQKLICPLTDPNCPSSLYKLRDRK